MAALAVGTSMNRIPLKAVTTSMGSHDLEVDTSEVGKYFMATLFQFTTMALVLRSIDAIVSTSLSSNAVALFFAALSIRSRIFSFFDHSRPRHSGRSEEMSASRVKRPKWTPPGYVFPVMWLGTAGLRAWSSALVYRVQGRLCTPALLCLVAQFCIGDTWNTIANKEKRLGVSVVAAGLVLASVFATVWQYYSSVPRAGLILSPSAVWIFVATAFTWDIWRINTPVQALVPLKRDPLSASWGLKYSVFGILMRSLLKLFSKPAKSPQKDAPVLRE